MQANRKRLGVSLLYTTVAGETLLALDVVSSLLTPATRALSAHYPGVRVTGPGQRESDMGVVHSAYLRLVPDIRSLRIASDFEDDLSRSLTEPASGLLAAVADQGDSLKASIRFSLEAFSQRRRRHARKVAAVASGPLARWLPALAESYAMRANGSWWERLLFFPLSFLPPGEPPRDVLRKLEDHLYWVVIELQVIAPSQKTSLARKRLAGMAAAFAPFTAPGSVTFKLCSKPRRSMLSVAELAALWHPPLESTTTDSVAAAALPHLPAPIGLAIYAAEEGILPLGNTTSGQQRLVGVRPTDRMHQLLLGKSGCGKSTLLHTQIAADVLQQGVGLVDPHGDLVEDVLATAIPRSRTNDVVVLDPTHPASPSINPLECRDPAQRALVAENNLAAMSKVFGFNEQSAPRLLHILRFTLLALVGTDQGTLLSIRPMLTDKRFRKQVVSQVEDPEVRSFWIDEVGSWTDRYEQEAMPAILNKTGQFTAHPELRKMFGKVHGGIDLRTLMDDGKIVLVSLSQGKLGEPAARFAGSMIMAGFQNAAMTRADIDRQLRRPFYLYADEYATFVNESFADLLAQSRKYGLFLTGAQQLVSQVEEPIMDAMFGNLATLVVFQVAQKDAELLAGELASDATPADLMRLPKYHAVVRTTIDGVPSRPFVIKTLPPPRRKSQHADPATVRRVLARRYGQSAVTNQSAR